MSALAVRGLTSGYGGVAVLHDFDMVVEAGEVLALLGANGAGKTTALLAILGALPATAGKVELLGSDMTGWPTERIARQGVVLVPDDRGLFAQLTVAEHLRLALRPGRPAGLRDEALDTFPQLKGLLKRRCALLSGGEQRMLALAKAMIFEPRVLLIDEMSLGLGPLVVQGLLPIIRSLASERGVAVVLVEQHAELALRISDKAIVMSRGRISLAGDAAKLRESRSVLEAAYLDLDPERSAEGV